MSLTKKAQQSSISKQASHYEQNQIMDSVPKKKKIKVLNTKSFDMESTRAQKIRIQENSPYGHLKSWRLVRLIVKSLDDVRQE